MANLESNLNNLSETFDKLNEIRETSLTISRAIVRDCSKSIRFIHRNDIKGAEEFIDSAKKKITELKKLTEKVSEISFAGYVLDAEREYVEAVLLTPLLLITENICAPSLEESTCNVLNLPSWIYEAPISNH